MMMVTDGTGNDDDDDHHPCVSGHLTGSVFVYVFLRGSGVRGGGPQHRLIAIPIRISAARH